MSGRSTITGFEKVMRKPFENGKCPSRKNCSLLAKNGDPIVQLQPGISGVRWNWHLSLTSKGRIRRIISSHVRSSLSAMVLNKKRSRIEPAMMIFAITWAEERSHKLPHLKMKMSEITAVPCADRRNLLSATDC